MMAARPRKKIIDYFAALSWCFQVNDSISLHVAVKGHTFFGIQNH